VRLSTAITFRDEEALPLDFVEPAPDAVRLARAEGVVEARGPDGTSPADRFGVALTSESYFFPFEVWRCEERSSIVSAARGFELPIEAVVPIAAADIVFFAPYCHSPVSSAPP
jgi:hypothetical protein